MGYFKSSHRRVNPLTGEQVLVSPHRTKRPWQGAEEFPQIPGTTSYEESCYLCPGNERAGGIRNPHYKGTFVFTNDFSALLPEADGGSEPESGTESILPENKRNALFQAKRERGLCRVVCFSPRHDLTISRMKVEDIRSIVDTWDREYRTMAIEPWISHVQIFENRGSTMGCSNPHPHGQIWAQESIPSIPFKETENQRSWRFTHHSCLLCDYLKEELSRKDRIVLENPTWVALVPWWATWPFEVMLLPRRHIHSIDELTGRERDDLSEMMKHLGTRYDNLFRTLFPYSMGIHQAPVNGDIFPEWHMHFHYYPPLLRSATVKKFMVGYEMLAEPQRDLTAEESARRLRELSDIHFIPSEGENR